MTSVTNIDLLSGEDIPLDGIGTFRPTKLKALTSSGFGLTAYNGMLSLLCVTAEDISAQFGIEFGEKSHIFTLLTQIRAYRDVLNSVLCFFMREEPVYSEAAEAFYLYDGGRLSGAIDNSNFAALRSIILKANCLGDEASVANGFANGTARSIYKKLQDGRRRRKKTAHRDPNMEISNVISAVCAYHSSYNLLNVWDLTVYQLYDQFARIHMKQQLDVSSMRWAAWGKNDFDFSLWYQCLKKD